MSESSMLRCLLGSAEQAFVAIICRTAGILLDDLITLNCNTARERVVQAYLGCDVDRMA